MSENIDAMAEGAVETMQNDGGQQNRPRNRPQDSRNDNREGVSTGRQGSGEKKTQDALWDDEPATPERKPAPKPKAPPKHDETDKKPLEEDQENGRLEKVDGEPEPKPATKKYKVDGKEIELTEDQERAAIQKVLTADKRFQEAATLGRTVQGMYEKLRTAAKENPAIAAIIKGEDPTPHLEQMYLDD